MKILQLHNAGAADLPSGETIVVASESAALRRLGHEVLTYQTPPRGRTLADNLDRINVFSSRKTYRTVNQLIDKFRPDVVHAHGILPDLTVSAFRACRNRNVPVVQTLHNYRWICIEGGLFRRESYCDECLRHSDWQGIRHRCARGSLAASLLLTLNNRHLRNGGRLARLVDRFLAVSDYVRTEHLRAGFPAGQLTVKYNGVKIPQADDGKHPGPRPTVVFAGRLDVAKGTSTLSQVPRELPHCQFQIIGSGPAADNLEHHIGDLENVQLLGRLSASEVSNRLLAADCTLLPSLVPESFGLVAAESLACGTPIVASQIGGLVSWSRRAGGGIGVDPGEGAGAYARAIQNITSDVGQHAVYSRAGRRFAESTLSLDATTAQLVGIYRQLVESPRTDRPNRSGS